MIFSRFKWNKSTTLELTDPIRAHVYYKNKRHNLITGFPEPSSIQQLLEELSEFQLQDKVVHPRVYHFYYDLGLLMKGIGHEIEDETPLAVVIEYKKSSKKKKRSSRLNCVPLKSLERPSWSEYKLAFQQIQNELLEGNCYQVNLTYPFDFETEEVIDPRDLCDYFFSLDGLGAYAHSTYLGEEMILSNSPECLFQYRRNEIFTMPIKGTKKRTKDFKSDWREMLNDPKEEAELLMITDLLRNDLNRLDSPRARVVKLRAPLLVPNLLHQYSLVSLKLEKKVSLLKVIEALFPGGSITGAPKKRVMEIIQCVERFQRGIYCGSTILCYKDKKVGSINIRTAYLNPSERLWRYAAGGGITLLSRPVEEFQEMESKVKSFLTLLQAPGY